MPTYYVDTDVVGGSANGADWANAYATLAGCIAGISKTLTAPLIINCRGATADTTQVYVNGFNATATNTITIQVPIESRAKGKYDSTKYHLAVDAGYSHACRVNNTYTTMIGIQAINTETNGISCFYNDTTPCAFIGCIAYGQLTAGADGFANGGFSHINDVGPTDYINCMAVDCVGPGFMSRTWEAFYYNCVAVGNTGLGFFCSGYQKVIASNCYSGGNTAGDCYTGANTTYTLTTCRSGDGTFGTTVAYTNSGTAGTRFTSIANNAENIHIAAATSSLINIGTDLSGTVALARYDIDGNDRGTGGASTWDIGCHEYQAAAAAGKPYYYFNQ